MFKGRRVVTAAGCLLSSCFVAVVLVWSLPEPSEPASAWQLSGATQQDVDYPVLVTDLPALEDPELLPADEAAIDDEAIVIGIVVDGEARAYLRSAFEMAPARHVLIDEIESQPVAITHCDRIRCTRVLTSQQAEEPLDMRVGGWREDQTMELLINGQEFSQKSKDLPLVDVPFSELPWGMWRELFPDTLVYLGTAGAG